MALRDLFLTVAVGAAVVGYPVAAAAQGGEPASNGVAQRAVVEKYCVTCHSERLKTGGLVLEKIDLEQHSPSIAALREKVIRKVRAGAMPPARAPRGCGA